MSGVPEGHERHFDGSHSLKQLVEHASHYLPAQAPIHAFVHHNTLHAFEEFTFEDAVKKAATIFGTAPFASEADFASYLAAGRITPADLEAVLDARSNLGVAPLWPEGPSQREFWLMRSQIHIEVPETNAVQWMLHESDLLESFSGARSLWDSLAAHAPTPPAPSVPLRRRDQLLYDTGVDTDEWVHPLLIRITGAFLDQGISYWPMPNRELGLLRSARRLYSAAFAPPDRAFAGLATVLRQQESSNWDAEKTIRWGLEDLGHTDKTQWPEVIRSTLLGLPGWAGIINQFELNPDKAPVKCHPTSLMDFLALRLILDVLVARNLGGGRGDRPHLFSKMASASPPAEATPNLSAIYEAFVLSRRMSIDPASLQNAANAKAWVKEVSSFNSVARCELLMAAFERRHRIGVLDGLMANAQITSNAPVSKVQIVFCIDDREESYRRHVEELDPAIETFAYPGFFGVAMHYQGAEDIRPRALCPVVVKPTHAVHEVKADTGSTILGHLIHHYHVGRSTLFRGLFFTLLGIIATLPLVAIVLFPRLATYRKPKKNRIDPELKFRRDNDAPTRSDGLAEGYTHEEMANVVGKMLMETGLQHRMTPLILFIGHGSTSVNNPHIAAYGCGATAGGSGGANARVLASMANEPETRAILKSRGIHIPSETWFVGGLHNTCTDDVLFFDETKIPRTLVAQFEESTAILQRASAENAHERCRLFGVVPLDLSPEDAKNVVEERSVDLSEPRPEYNHTKNSIAVIGRRKWTRGLFLDKRAFLVSYDGTKGDPDGRHLTNALMGSVPVGVGINLEYLFGFVDNAYYGSGSKLPHNITGLFAVMDGHASDLRTGLYRQMIEVHEPIRLLAVIETSPETFLSIMASRPAVDRLVRNRWLHVCVWNPEKNDMFLFEDGNFQRYTPESNDIVSVKRSRDLYQGTRVSLPCAHVEASFQERTLS